MANDSRGRPHQEAHPSKFGKRDVPVHGKLVRENIDSPATTTVQRFLSHLDEAISATRGAKSFGSELSETYAEQSAQVAIKTLLAGLPLGGQEWITGVSYSTEMDATGEQQSHIEYLYTSPTEPHSFDRATPAKILVRSIFERRAYFNKTVNIEDGNEAHGYDATILEVGALAPTVSAIINNTLTGLYGNPSTSDLIFVKHCCNIIINMWEDGSIFHYFVLRSLPSNVDSESEPDLVQLLERILDYARSHDKQSVRSYAALLLPEWGISQKSPENASTATELPTMAAKYAAASAQQSLSLPPEAPIKWKDREPGETGPDFTRRVYGPWLEGGIPKRVLRKLDAALVNELNTWVRNGNEMPADIKILTVSEENDRLLNAGPEAIGKHLGKFTGAEALREAQRLRSAEARRR
ncbi:hypothetical protein [Sphingobium lactosutens]|nr:hypothetical protein [Sphingobium lactosutens]